MALHQNYCTAPKELGTHSYNLTIVAGVCFHVLCMHVWLCTCDVISYKSLFRILVVYT